MLLEVTNITDKEVIARSDLYRNGVKVETLNLHFETGLLHRPKVGNKYAVTTEWLGYLNSIGKMTFTEEQ